MLPVSCARWDSRDHPEEEAESVRQGAYGQPLSSEKNVEVTKSNQVFCADITYMGMRKVFIYLVGFIHGLAFAVRALLEGLHHPRCRLLCGGALRTPWPISTLSFPRQAPG